MCNGLLLNTEDSDRTFVTTGGTDDEHEHVARANKENEQDNQTEQDEFGGSWFDDFNDESGVEWRKNLTYDAGSYILKKQYVEVNQIANNPFNYWKFDDGNGNTAIDSGSNGNHGTLINNPSWVNGKYNGGLDFDGANTYVDAEYIFNDFSSGITVGSWINGHSWNGGGGWLDWNMIISSGTDSSYDGFNFGVARDGKLRLSISHSPQYVVDWQNGGGNQILQNNEWYFVAFTWDGQIGTNNVKMYVGDNIDQEFRYCP